MTSVYLEVDIGDPTVYAAEQAAYQTTCDYFKNAGRQCLGLSCALTELDTDSLELLQASYEADPNWSCKVMP